MVELAEDRENPVEESGDGPKRARAVKQPSNRAQQVPEQIAGTRHGRDVQHDLVQVDHQAEQVKVERAEDQVQDLAVTGGLRDRNRERLGVGTLARSSPWRCRWRSASRPDW